MKEIHDGANGEYHFVNRLSERQLLLTKPCSGRGKFRGLLFIFINTTTNILQTTTTTWRPRAADCTVVATSELLTHTHSFSWSIYASYMLLTLPQDTSTMPGDADSKHPPMPTTAASH